MNQIIKLCEQGDIKIEWDPEDEASIDNAKAEWERMKADGYEFFEITGENARERVTRWDKRRGLVVAAPGVKKPGEKKTGKRPKAMEGGPNEMPVFERFSDRREPVRPGPQIGSQGWGY